MTATTIQWTDHSVSPIRARNKATGKVFHFCERVSAGCARCYAATMAQRFGLPDYTKANREQVEFFFDDSKLAEVMRRKKPTQYFWEDCSDLFGAWVPEEWIDKCIATMALTPWHTHQVLTKRADRLPAYFFGLNERRRGFIHEHRGLLVESLGRFLSVEEISRAWHRMKVFHHGIEPAQSIGDATAWPWPLPNVWLGVSVENQATADERIPHLLSTPAAVRFLSCEPLLGPIDLRTGVYHMPHDGAAYGTSLDGIGWTIVGGESGPKARPCAAPWITSIAAQCVRARVPVFVKQMGSNCQTRYYDNHWRDFYESSGWEWPEPIGWSIRRDGQPRPDAKVRLKFNDRKGGDESEWPVDLRIRQMPAGRSGEAE